MAKVFFRQSRSHLFPQKDSRVTQSSKTALKEIRIVNVGKDNLPVYPSNKIITSKYTLWNFIPKNLTDQFRRIANFYFLCIGIISSIVESPIGPLTCLLPLMFVIVVTAIKQGYEDFIRHRADAEANNTKVRVLRNMRLEVIPSKKISVGDIVKVNENEDIPCDLVLLTSSHESSKCYVTTSSLDGETNLKTFYCPKSLKCNIKTENIKYLHATIECENPTPDLYRFNGRIEFSKITSDLLKKNSLQKQASLTDTCYEHFFKPFSEVRSGDAFNSYPGTRLECNTFLPTPGDLTSLGNGILKHESYGSSSIQNIPLGKCKDFENDTKILGSRGGNHPRHTLDSAPVHETDPKPDAKTLTSQKTSSSQLEIEDNLKVVFYKDLKQSKSEPKRTLTLPKSSTLKHKKTYSNVTNMSRDPIFFNSLEMMKRASRRRASEREKLVDPLTAENLLLKGSTLKNTEYIYGCAVYTGQETKMALNSKLTRKKFSLAERSINKFLNFQLVLLIAESIASTILNATVEITSGIEKFRAIFPVDGDEQSRGSFISIFKDLFLFVMVYNYLLPISLYVTLEMTKFLGALLFKWDLSLYDESTDQSALCNTSDLNEELGEVEILFTDKTGTLTENNLRFHSCSINGVSYEEKEGKLHRMDGDSPRTESDSPLNLNDCPEETELFLLSLTLCNTVQVIVQNENEEECFRYSAASPDEKALVEAMQRLDIVFANDDDFIIVRNNGRSRIFQKLEVLEFSSRRKRMSVIVKDEDENIMLYCKGAESAVIPKVIKGPTEETLNHVSEFATRGLRTLVIGCKALTEEEYSSIEERLQKARETLSSNREEILAKTFEEIECDLTLLGATGVEDKLQEGVRDTLESMREAGIKVWMLTGDKVETALKISLSCGHFKSNIERVALTNINSEDDCEQVLNELQFRISKNHKQEFGLIADGTSLQYALGHADLFRDVCMKCSAVVCCRLSPIQKSEVVKLVKRKKNGPVVAAIGDGANDVSMIKEAHIGLGIMGKEGRQAVLCSDFAFAKFRFLRRALLVHGHWYYVRTANLVQYFFYKNIVFITPQFYFFFMSGYSIQQLYDSLFYVCYNTLFTSLPVLIYGVFEQNYPADKLLNFPSLYKIHRRNALLTWKNFFLWFIFGIWHSLVVFFIPTLLSGSNSFDPALDCIENYGTIIFHNSVIVVNLKLLLHSKFWSAIFVTSIFLSIFMLFVITLAYSSIYMFEINYSYYWKFNELIQSPDYWLLCVITCAIALIPDVLFYAYLNSKTKLIKSIPLLDANREDDVAETTY